MFTLAGMPLVLPKPRCPSRAAHRACCRIADSDRFVLHAQSLIDKLHDLPREKLAEVQDFIDFLREKQRRTASILNEQLQAAVDAGHITAPAAGYERSSASNVPPVIVPGTLPSEMVLKDRQ